MRTLFFALILLLTSSAPALALDRNSQTNKFSWGDDLTETVESPGGINQALRTPSQLKPNHLPDIKTAIDISVTACGVSSNVWSQSETQTVGQIGHPGSAVKASQVNALRRAIEALYTARNNNTISNYFTGSVSPGQPITKRHINDMRRALDDLIMDCSLPQCGNGTVNAGEQCDAGASNGLCPSACSLACTTNCCTGGHWVQVNSTEYFDFPNGVPPDWAQQLVEGAGYDSSRVINPAAYNPGSCNVDDLHIETESGGMNDSLWIAWHLFQCQGSCGGPPPPGAVCGNGSVESGEQCDDWNTSNGDGCSSTCRTEACFPDGHVFDRGGFAPLDTVYDQGLPQCCSGYGVCYGGTTMCECGDGGTYLGGGPQTCDPATMPADRPSMCCGTRWSSPPTSRDNWGFCGCDNNPEWWMTMTRQGEPLENPC